MDLPFIPTTVAQEFNPAAVSTEKAPLQSEWLSTHGPAQDARPDDSNFATMLRQAGEREQSSPSGRAPEPSSSDTAGREADPSIEPPNRHAQQSAEPCGSSALTEMVIPMPIGLRETALPIEGKKTVPFRGESVGRGFPRMAAAECFSKSGTQWQAFSPGNSPAMTPGTKAIGEGSVRVQGGAEKRIVPSAMAAGRVIPQAVAPAPDMAKGFTVPPAVPASVAQTAAVVPSQTVSRSAGPTGGRLTTVEAADGRDGSIVSTSHAASRPRLEPLQRFGDGRERDVKHDLFETPAGRGGSDALTGGRTRSVLRSAKVMSDVGQTPRAAAKEIPVTAADARAREAPSAHVEKTAAAFLASGRPMGPEGMSAVPGHPLSELAGTATADVLDQVVQKVLLTVKQGVSEIRIDLKPEALGQVQLKIVSEDQQLRISILTEHSGVREIVESGLAALKDTLLAQGVQVDRVDVSVFSTADSDKGAHQHHQGGFQPRRHPDDTPDEMPQNESSKGAPEGSDGWGTGGSLIGVFA